ncbi:hypothetical protein [Streptomyces olivoreticuli]|uniref:hypothetical protein n=1 Tax=Streptomyces olivoreticuli TaxID=68246 RepID=UPI0013C2E2F8|nr:hypothetical protein [Streptomyces olivoreticuli]
MNSTPPAHGQRNRAASQNFPALPSKAVAAELEACAAIRDMWQYGFPRCALTRYADTAGRLADSLASEAIAAELEARAAIRDMWEYGFPHGALTRYAEAAGRLADGLA